MKRNDLVYGLVHGAGLLADIASPDSGGPFPVILAVHGGRWIRGSRTQQSAGAIDVEQWAGFGFFAMRIDYRLVTCTPAPACYQDMYCAIRWVHAHAAESNLDRNRIILLGQSAGGHMVSLAATLGAGKFEKTGGCEDQDHDFAAAISVSGAYDLPKLDWGSGWLPTGEDWFTARQYASPIQHVSAQTKPILLFHSDDDPSVPIRQALDMVGALSKAGAPYEFVHYKDKGHLIVNDEVIQESRKFIERMFANQH